MERAVWLDYLEGLGFIECLESLERLENLQLRPWRLSALALVFLQLILQLFYTFFQLFYLVGLRLNCFVLGLSAAQSGSRHAFFYAALLLFCGLLVMLNLFNFVQFAHALHSSSKLASALAQSQISASVRGGT